MTNQDKALNSLAKEIRLSLGLRQQELAELAGVSESEVDSFEGHLPCPLDKRNKILKVLCGNMKHQIMSRN